MKKENSLTGIPHWQRTICNKRIVGTVRLYYYYVTSSVVVFSAWSHWLKEVAAIFTFHEVYILADSLGVLCQNSCQYTCIHVWQVEFGCWCQWWKKQLQLVKEPGDEGCSCWLLKAVDCWLLKAIDCWLLKTIHCCHGGPRSVAAAASCRQASLPCIPGGQSPGCGYPSSVPVVCLLHTYPWHRQWIEICWRPLHCAA